jgi:hypothetical protein
MRIFCDFCKNGHKEHEVKDDFVIGKDECPRCRHIDGVKLLSDINKQSLSSGISKEDFGKLKQFRVKDTQKIELK